jgi:hypothetical protein
MPKPRYSVRARAYCAILGLGLFGFAVTTAQAQTVTVDNPLTFGRVAIVDNSMPRDLRLLPGGAYIADSGYVIFPGEEPELGQYTINGQTANTVLDIALDLNSADMTGGGSYFDLVDPFTVPAIVQTGPTGSVTFELGATLRSSGDGTPFASTQYSGTYTMTITPQ